MSARARARATESKLVCLCEKKEREFLRMHLESCPGEAERGERGREEEEAGVLLEQVPPREELPTVFKSVSICACLPLCGKLFAVYQQSEDPGPHNFKVLCDR